MSDRWKPPLQSWPNSVFRVVLDDSNGQLSPCLVSAETFQQAGELVLAYMRFTTNGNCPTPRFEVRSVERLGELFEVPR